LNDGRRLRPLSSTRAAQQPHTTQARVRSIRMSIDTTVERIRTVELAAHVGERVALQGWLHAVRRLGGVTFVVLRDGWGTAQAVAEEAGQLAPIVDGAIQPESVIRLIGVVTASPQAPGGIELHQPEVEVITP